MNANLDSLLKAIKNNAGMSVETRTIIANAVNRVRSQLEQKQKMVDEKNNALEQSQNDLIAAREKLLQYEKLASLGQLTAGIAHEIKNPLNFVNNFSELSRELIEEVKDKLNTIKLTDGVAPNDLIDQIEMIIKDVDNNLAKIYEHGTRADRIVKSMLQHSRGGNGRMQLVNLNGLIEEYANLSYHGMRAGSNPINVEIELELDDDINEIEINPEEMSRVFINLFNNAFDAMWQKQQEHEEYKPKLTVRSQKRKEQVVIEVKDNGPGITEEIKDKILQPFFTTKRGSEGTGLGLYISNDIVKAHGGIIDIESEAKSYTTFIITIPIKHKSHEISSR